MKEQHEHEWHYGEPRLELVSDGQICGQIMRVTRFCPQCGVYEILDLNINPQEDGMER